MRVRTETHWNAWITPALELYHEALGWSFVLHFGPWIIGLTTG